MTKLHLTDEAVDPRKRSDRSRAICGRTVYGAPARRRVTRSRATFTLIPVSERCERCNQIQTMRDIAQDRRQA